MKFMTSTRYFHRPHDHLLVKGRLYYPKLPKFSVAPKFSVEPEVSNVHPTDANSVTYTFTSILMELNSMQNQSILASRKAQEHLLSIPMKSMGWSISTPTNIDQYNNILNIIPRKSNPI